MDASIFIEAERDRFDLAGFLESLGDAPVAMAAITASALLHGVERAREPEMRFRRHQFVERLIADFPVLPFGLAEAREHARIWAMLATDGKPIGPHDLQIAATALVNAAAVATLNDKEFQRVPGLSLAPIALFVVRKRR